MPFIEQTPRTYSRSAIEILNRAQIGVYGIIRDGFWIYIGKGDIRARMLDHLNGDNPLINLCQPTHWVAELTTGDPSYREKQLIREHGPHCNMRVG